MFIRCATDCTTAVTNVIHLIIYQVSLTSIICRIVESVIRHQTADLSYNSYFSNNQYRFIKGRSVIYCITVILYYG